MTPKSIGVIYLSDPTSKSSLKTLGPGIVELLLRQALVYQQTDWHVQSNIPLFFEGGMITVFKVKMLKKRKLVICTGRRKRPQYTHPKDPIFELNS